MLTFGFSSLAFTELWVESLTLETVILMQTFTLADKDLRSR